MKFIKFSRRPTKSAILNDIKQLEQTLNMELPVELKDFLFKAAGTCPEPDCFRIQNFPYGDSDICFGFFGDTEDSFTQVFNDMRNRIPANFLPIGYGGQGDFICYVLSGENAGNIWYWDHENETSTSCVDYSNCYKCSDDLQSFLDGLFEDDEDEDYDEEDEE